jgi:hypothetical protein
MQQSAPSQSVDGRGAAVRPATEIALRRYLPEARGNPGDIPMRIIAIVTAGAFMLAGSGAAQAGPFSPDGLSADGLTSIELVATNKKSETVTEKLKRAWKNLVGYKFDVSCPLAGSRTCSETGTSRADARGKCIARNFGCWVADAR